MTKVVAPNRKTSNLKEVRQPPHLTTKLLNPMPRIAQSTSNVFDFKVNQVRLYTHDGKPTDIFATQREDNGQVLGSVSQRYGIVQNADAINVVEDAFQSHGLGDFKRTANVLRGGAELA